MKFVAKTFFGKYLVNIVIGPIQHHEDQMAGKPGNSISYRIAKKLVLSR